MMRVDAKELRAWAWWGVAVGVEIEDPGPAHDPGVIKLRVQTAL